MTKELQPIYDQAPTDPQHGGKIQFGMWLAAIEDTADRWCRAAPSFLDDMDMWVEMYNKASPPRDALLIFLGLEPGTLLDLDPGTLPDNLTPAVRVVIYLLDALTDEERTEAFYFYCLHCGTTDYRVPNQLRGCQCWNDE
jgi:hypothetical protein